MRSKIERLAAGCGFRLKRLERHLELLETEIQNINDPDILSSVELLLFDLKSFESLFVRIKEKWHLSNPEQEEAPALLAFRKLIKHIHANPTNDVVTFIQGQMHLEISPAFRLANSCVTNKSIEEWEDEIERFVQTTESESI